MKLRWLEITREYTQWDDRDKEYYATQYTDDPVLQYFDENDQQWIDVPTVKKKKKMQ